MLAKDDETGKTVVVNDIVVIRKKQPSIILRLLSIIVILCLIWEYGRIMLVHSLLKMWMGKKFLNEMILIGRDKKDKTGRKNRNRVQHGLALLTMIIVQLTCIILAREMIVF